MMRSVIFRSRSICAVRSATSRLEPLRVRRLPQHGSEDVRDRREERPLVRRERAVERHRENAERMTSGVQPHEHQSRCGDRASRAARARRSPWARLADARLAAQVRLTPEPQRHARRADRVGDALEHAGQDVRRRIARCEGGRDLRYGVQQGTVTETTEPRMHLRPRVARRRER